jgi:hypothetical protein
LKKLTKQQKKNLELGIAIFISLLTILLWRSVVIYPVKIFVVLLHEMSHGIAAILSSGKIIKIIITPELGGETVTSGGVKFIIASSGYLGSLFFGAMLFYSAFSKKFSMWFNTILSVMILLFTVNYLEGSFTIIFALAFTIFLFLSPRILNDLIHSYSMKILGLISSLYVLIDIKEDLITLRIVPSDAQMLADITGIPAFVWGLAWLIVTLITIYYMYKFSYEKGFKKKLR